MPRGIKEAQGNDGFTLEVLTQEAHENLTTDCHASNPCELKSHLAAKKSHPMIEWIQWTRKIGASNHF
ncbi:hypothetical protein Tco_0505589 [Tanacetum coccineum]